METSNEHMIIGIGKLLAALTLAASLGGCDEASTTPRVSRTVGDVDGFDLILDDSAVPVAFGQFSIGYAKKSNYAYFTYRGQLYVSVGGGSVLIRPLTNSPAKYVVRETVLEGKERGETTRSLLQIVDKESGAELAQRGLVARQVEGGTGWTGDHAAKFVRTVLASSALPARPWGREDYPDAASDLDLQLTSPAQPYPSSSAVGPCSLETRIERTSHGQLLVTPSFQFWPNAPIKFVACDSGSRLASRDILDVACVDQQHGEAARFQQYKQRYPVNTGGFHRHRVYATRRQPIGQRIEIDREARKLPDGLIVPVWWHGHKMECAANVDAAGIRMGDGQSGSGLARFERGTSIALRHGLLHHSGWNVVPHRVRRLAHSLKRDIRPTAANRQAGSPMSMTSPMTTLTRGQYAPLLHRSSAAPHSTLPQTTRQVFLRRDLRHRADYFANPSIERAVSGVLRTPPTAAHVER